MADLFEPFIEPQDYDAFCRLLHPDLPNAYDEWFDLQLEKGKDLALAGHKVRQIKVEPNEFARFCNATRADRTLDSLRKFAATIAGGKNRY